MAFHHLESACRHEGFDFRSRECQGPGELTSTALWIVFFEMAVMAVSLFLPYFNAMWVERDPSSISSFLGLPFGLPLIVTRSGAMQIFLILIFAINVRSAWRPALA
ncbi:hypothetical protein EMIHUDRAFT_364988 [Emiliania huxleyi CCMP1516]|uniref:Uncharacterized protein n=2 Tax=Emiliania huxleyi TaxID=2903 RepID=A0A0D3K6T7_EMIH1|nr:hypothetical protein EMIHUDRAFT_355329 [Emiliania huxleyi CCMP1516]XP_005783901.1 hypothetical protein EMIHUDRAFT_364988 [Emiliania huxleyi CCMP1516]EOD20078.1 hypothetical protein EMIHUDRAFT_355329 [Emiliania huxleyi CCMP1516]EOD31472.1 hypothetical protein EMIHUDRAFT_364988 [Emiliania huxleyi CCMP1516]|eukprot:XP_005772507.1 hypothetical protein EMIHUDRAFT_355329 [Emiliania huxleyi CCMP1516]